MTLTRMFPRAGIVGAAAAYLPRRGGWSMGAKANDPEPACCAKQQAGKIAPLYFGMSR